MAPRHLLRRLPVLALVLLAWPVAAQAETATVRSPNGRVAIDLIVEQDAAPQYRVTLDGKEVIAPSPVGLTFDLGQIGHAPARVLSRETTAVDQTFDLVVGKADSVRESYTQTILTLDNPGPVARYQIVARAYDDGVALRYRIPQQGDIARLKLRSEDTRFDFPADYRCWAAIIGRFDSSFEAEYDPMPASGLHDFHLVMNPLVCKAGAGNTTFAIAESDLKDYPGLYLAGRGDGGLGVRIALPPRFDTDRHARSRGVVLADVALDENGFETPWRAVMIGDAPGDLIESHLVTSLAAPVAIGDTSWIRPSKTAWDWWSYFDIKVSQPGVNTQTYMAYVDFAASMGLEDILIDEGWSVGSSVDPNPDADVTRPIPALDMPRLLDHARSKKVGVWVWVQWHQLDRQMDEALATYAAWGLRGIKVDFLNRNDQEMVDWYHRLLASAAKHKLLVNLHGAFPPAGLNRTYPNYITQEGVLGAENNKWSARITARHNVTLPFTRMILGPMDYTPGGFRAVNPAEFPKVQRFAAPYVQTTRGQAIAMYVVYDSPLQIVADSPAIYRKADGSPADGAAFIGEVPTSWDETRVLAGDIGEYVVIARRAGDVWYVGAMTNEDGRKVTIPLDFLGQGTFTAKIYADGRDINSLAVSERAVTGRSRLTLTMADNGGGVIVIRPQPPQSQ